ncbi:MAG: ATP-binding protein [Phycisphaerales bacterium]
MGGSRRITWLVFIVGVIAVVDVLGWVTWRVLRLERDQAQSQAEATRQEAMGRALWRMDSIVLPLLAVESARPYFEYMAFYPANRPFDRMWAPPEPGDVPVPSPLLGEAGDFALLHFERSADGTLTSPQAPAGDQAREAAARAGVPPVLLSRAEIRLYELDRIQRSGLADGRETRAPETLLGAAIERELENLRRGAAGQRENLAATLPVPGDDEAVGEDITRAGRAPDTGAQPALPSVAAGVPMDAAAQPSAPNTGPSAEAAGPPRAPARDQTPLARSAREQTEPAPPQAGAPIQSTEELANAVYSTPPSVVGDERQDYAARQMAVNNATQTYSDAGRANNRFRTQIEQSRAAQPTTPEPTIGATPETPSRPAEPAPTARSDGASEAVRTRSAEAGQPPSEQPATGQPAGPATTEGSLADERSLQQLRLAGVAPTASQARNEETRSRSSPTPAAQPDPARDGVRAFLEHVASATGAETGARDRESESAAGMATASPSTADSTHSLDTAQTLSIASAPESNTIATVRAEPPSLYQLGQPFARDSDRSAWLALSTAPTPFDPDATFGVDTRGDTRDDPRVAAGPLVPTWIGAADAAEPALLLVRRVTIDDQARDQGVWIDWPALRASLEASVADLFPFAEVRPLAGPPAAALVGDAQRLATIPAVLIPGPLSPALAPTPSSLWTPTRTTLLVGWIAVAIAVVSIGIVLRKAIDLGERRGRFVSAVTHELRTPLTTFRLYSQMLASGQVADEAKRTRYAQTLDRESQRLSAIVESVLEYARLGRRSGAATMQRTTAAELIDRVRPTLLGRAERAGMTIELPSAEALPAASVRADADRVERILLNLVDNACKYACDADDKRIELTAAARDGRLLLTVRDRGPGVPTAERARIFAAFHRAKHHEASPSPGLGLGLALSRGLAREMNGDLRLLDEPTGAAFELSLPLTP